MTNKLKYFIGNWKMFGDIRSLKIINKINKFNNKHKKIAKKKIIFCVPSTLIYFFNKNMKTKHILFGAQNCHYHYGHGPYTGSLSTSMLKNVGAKYIILGHSENRNEGDTNEIIKKKIESSLKENLYIIFCIGETYSQKKRGKTFSILKNQIKSTLKKNFDASKIILAYEPVWSIGTNKIPKISELTSVVRFIKKEVKKISKKKNQQRFFMEAQLTPKM